MSDVVLFPLDIWCPVEAPFTIMFIWVIIKDRFFQQPIACPRRGAAPACGAASWRLLTSAGHRPPGQQEETSSSHQDETVCNWSELVFFSDSSVWSSWIDLWFTSSLFRSGYDYVVGLWLADRLLQSGCLCRLRLLWQESSPPSSTTRPNNSLFHWVKGGVTWKMSSSEVHEGVKLQTPLCPRPRASKAISSFIDRAAGLQPDGVGCSRHPAAPWLLLFPGHLLSIAATFPISQACCVKTDGIAIMRRRLSCK